MANVIGQRVLRKEDPRFLTGQGRYVDNLPLEGALYATFVRSPYPHARIDGIDASAATAAGAQVFTAADVELEPRAAHFPGIEPRMARPVLASGVVRYVGEIVAVVLSEDRDSGVDVAELVHVDYEPLDALIDPEEAAKDEMLL